MNYRLIEHLLQESPPCFESDHLAGVAAVLFCSGFAAVHPATDTQVWLVIAVATTVTIGWLKFGQVLQGQSDRLLDAILTHNEHNADQLALQRTERTALADRHARRHAAPAAMRQSPNRLTVQQSATGQLVRVITGVAVLIMLLAVATSALFGALNTGLWLSAQTQTLVYLIGAVLAALLLNDLSQPKQRVVFDCEAGVFWIEQARWLGAQTRHSAHMPLHQITALQRIAHIKSSALLSPAMLMSASTRGMQELNIVFNHGKRVNIICHSNAAQLQKDATLLSNFLQVPVWAHSV